MVFFNYATMQMAAKIVYYGPGLCGKTTNLQFIYGKTSPQSRGEMVSLETETDRTLFFDLLPIDVGVIGGFKTRLQLYTVPGQVFYNTTRKLVLKGVDGIVFVADSQQATLEANIDSLKNLRQNVAEIGLAFDEIPLVIQLNKRDLPNIAGVDEILDALDPERRHDHIESIAARGEGVFETLKLISKLTLRTLRRRMTGEEPVKPAPRRVADIATFRVKDERAAPPREPSQAKTTPIPAFGAAPPKPPPTFAAPAAAASTPQPAASRSVAPQAVEEEEIIEEIPASAEITEPEAAEVFTDSTLAKTADLDSRIIADAPIAEVPPPPPSAPVEIATPAEPEIDFSQTKRPAKVPAVKHVKVRSSVDIMAELEALRKRSTQSAPKTAARETVAGDIPVPRTKRDLHRTLVLQLPSGIAPQSKSVRVAVSFENEEGVLQTQEQTLELGDASDARSLSIDLKITLE